MHTDVFPSVFCRPGFVFNLKSHVLGVYILFRYLQKQFMLIVNNSKPTREYRINP